MDIGALIDRVIAREGDYSDHPADRGGATRWGITEAVARDRGYDGAMRALPRSTAAAIYRTDYWQGPGYDLVAERAEQDQQRGADQRIGVDDPEQVYRAGPQVLGDGGHRHVQHGRVDADQEQADAQHHQDDPAVGTGPGRPPAR